MRARTVREKSVAATACVGILVGAILISSTGLLATTPGEGSGTTDHADRWLIVEPVAEETIDDDVTVVAHDDERIGELTFLQGALERSEQTNERVTTELSRSENEAFVDSTRSIERIPDAPGFYVRYAGEVFQVYNQGLT